MCILTLLEIYTTGDLGNLHLEQNIDCVLTERIKYFGLVALILFPVSSHLSYRTFFIDHCFQYYWWKFGIIHF